MNLGFLVFVGIFLLASQIADSSATSNLLNKSPILNQVNNTDSNQNDFLVNTGIGYTCDSESGKCSCTTLSDCKVLKGSGECGVDLIDSETNTCDWVRIPTNFKVNNSLIVNETTSQNLTNPLL